MGLSHVYEGIIFTQNGLKFKIAVSSTYLFIHGPAGDGSVAPGHTEFCLSRETVIKQL